MKIKIKMTGKLPASVAGLGKRLGLTKDRFGVTQPKYSNNLEKAQLEEIRTLLTSNGYTEHGKELKTRWLFANGVLNVEISNRKGKYYTQVTKQDREYSDGHLHST
jgi:hypothetical protein